MQHCQELIGSGPVPRLRRRTSSKPTSGRRTFAKKEHSMEGGERSEDLSNAYFYLGSFNLLLTTV